MNKFNRRTNNEAITATNKIVVGAVYFLSVFYDKSGATVKVLSKNTKRNSAGWNSSVVVEVLVPFEVHGFDAKYYATGTVHTVNATNLYVERKFAAQGGAQ